MGNTYRDGFVHVCDRMCDTCIFRPGNRMMLDDGRVDGMVDEANANGSAIICHSTLYGDNAVCRGFFELHKTPILQVAERLGVLKFVSPEKV